MTRNTASTNANPGKGSGGDELLVDDIELIYNAKLTSLKVNGTDVPEFEGGKLSYEIEVSEAVTSDNIEAVADGKAALVEKKIEDKDGSQECKIIVYSGDMSKSTTYTVVAKKTTSISAVRNAGKSKNTPIYNLNGQRVEKASKGVYIIDGKKVMYE